MKFLPTLRSSLLFLCCTYTFATTPDYLSKWAQYRITEMFDNTTSQDLSEHFSEKAWEDFQTALNSSNIKEHQENAYETRITKFIKPVNITPAAEDQYFAQTTFLVKFSNQYASWLQPIELILTLKDTDGAISITQFEGQTADAVDVHNFAIEHAKSCKK